MTRGGLRGGPCGEVRGPLCGGDRDAVGRRCHLYDGAGLHPGAAQGVHQPEIGLDRLSDAVYDRARAVRGPPEVVEADQSLRSLPGGQSRGVLPVELLQARDRVAVGGCGRVLQHVQDTAFDGFAHHVFPAAGFGVGLFPFQADHVDEQALGEAVLAHDTCGQSAAPVGQFQVPVAGDVQQFVALHPGDGLTDGGSALVQLLGDAGTQGDHAFLLEFQDGAQVHLRGVDELRHAAGQARVSAVAVRTARPRMWPAMVKPRTAGVASGGTPMVSTSRACTTMK